MDWLVTGTRGGKPGRWKLQAVDQSDARQKAVAGGVAVQEVRRYPAAQVAAVAVPSTEVPQPEAADEAAVDPGHSAAGGPAPSVPDEAPSEVSVKEGSADSTPAPGANPEAPPDKFPKSARSAGSTDSTDSTDSTRSPQAGSPQASSPRASSRQPPKPKSLWGIAAIAAGVLGAATAFISPARAAAIPLSSAGLLLAILGILFSLKRKRSGLLLPAIGALVCAAAAGLAVYGGFHQDHQGQAAVPTTAQELADRSRADRIAHSNIQVQFIAIRPASAMPAPAAADTRKYEITFAYQCLASDMSVTWLVGQLRISDASGKEIETLTVFESFPQGLGTNPVRREDRWSLKPATAQLLQGDASQLKVEFDPSLVQ